MSNRRRLARERVEIYLVHLILAYRRMIVLAGLLLLVSASATLITDSLAGTAIMMAGVYLLLLGNSYHVVLYTARLGAWIGALWRRDD